MSGEVDHSAQEMMVYVRRVPWYAAAGGAVGGIIGVLLMCLLHCFDK